MILNFQDENTRKDTSNEHEDERTNISLALVRTIIDNFNANDMPAILDALLITHASLLSSIIPIDEDAKYDFADGLTRFLVNSSKKYAIATVTGTKLPTCTREDMLSSARAGGLDV
jgi:hypothetical protein